MRDDHRKLVLRTIAAGASVLTSLLWSSPVVNASPDVVGVWEEPVIWPEVAVHVMHLPPSGSSSTGQILFWHGKDSQDPPDDSTSIPTWVWNPTDGCLGDYDPKEDCFTEVPNDETNLFCAGHSALADGSILAAGGHYRGPNHWGLADTNRFIRNQAGNWGQWMGGIQDMAFRRWYPTLTTLPDGKVLAVSGSNRVCDGGTRSDQQCTEDTEDIDVGCPDDGPDIGTCDKIVIAEFPEVYDPDTNMWETLQAPLSIPFYPLMFVLPDGKVFYAGAESDAPYAVISTTDNRTLDVDSDPPTWTAVDISSVPGGSGVMYEPGKILKSGGDSPSVNGAEVIDMSITGSETWESVPPMAFARRRHQLTLLADGTILATGGTTNANLQCVCVGGEDDGEECAPSNCDIDCPPCDEGVCAGNGTCTQTWVAQTELFDPENKACVGGLNDGLGCDSDDDCSRVIGGGKCQGTWTTLASMLIPRMYHSTALLLPDGRVVSAGGGQGGGAVNDFPVAQFFSPPYLFDGANLAPRPSITSAPPSINYGDVFEVMSPDAADIQTVSLIRLGTVTHSFDSNQRFMKLPIENQVGNTLEVTAPSNTNIAPPGYYMLFLVNNAGTPSVAKYVHVDQPNVVWVDFNFGGLIETGTFGRPFKTLLSGVAEVQSGGILRIKQGSSNETLVITKRMTVDSYGGNATIGQQ